MKRNRNADNHQPQPDPLSVDNTNWGLLLPGTQVHPPFQNTTASLEFHSNTASLTTLAASTSGVVAPTSFLSRYVTPSDEWSHSWNSSQPFDGTRDEKSASEETVKQKTQSSATKVEPLPNDVVCGRGKGSYNCPGNRRFRTIVKKYISQYSAAKSKMDKSNVLQTILDVFLQTTLGRFVKWDKVAQEYVEIPLNEAREKVGHAMREAIASEDLVHGKQQAQQAFRVKHKSLLEQQQAIFEQMLSEEKPED